MCAGLAVLLSVGIVHADGEFYGELDLDKVHSFYGDSLTDFHREHVINQFGRHRADVGIDELAARMQSWLANIGGRLEVFYDFSADYELIAGLLSRCSGSASFSLEPFIVGYLLDDEDGERAAAASWDMSSREGLSRHHALADARALRARFTTVHG